MESKRLGGKVAVVTGASKGIGAGMAKQLAAEGAAVVVNYASSKAGADQVVKEIEASGGKAIAVQGDVAKSRDVERLFAPVILHRLLLMPDYLADEEPTGEEVAARVWAACLAAAPRPEPRWDEAQQRVARAAGG